MTLVNPAGFDMRNAADEVDVWTIVVHAVSRGRLSTQVFAHMMVEDRQALMSAYRDGLNQYARYGTIADNVALDIEHAVVTGADELPYTSY